MKTHGAFISARYSTDNQNPDSIEVQVSKCTEWCQQHQIPILGVYADMAISGMKETRPQFEAMMRDLQLGLADTVVIYDQSRMFRIVIDLPPQPADIHRQGILIHKFPLTLPHMRQDLFFGEHSAPVFHKIHKELVFHFTAPDLLSVFIHFAGVLLQSDPA